MAADPPRPGALVTGGSRGIGRAIAQLLAERGLRIALHYRADRPAAERALAELPGAGHQAFACDLLHPGLASGLWDQVADDFGPIDLLINNAGIYTLHPVLTTPLPEWARQWQDTLNANLLAPAHLSLRAAQAWAERPEPTPGWGRGRIVNISSRGAFRGEPEAPAYGAAKAGLNALSQSMAKALARTGIYVYCVAPGWVSTDMARAHLEGSDADEVLAQHPIGRVATPEEIARAVVFCALDAPASMTASIIDVNGASYLRS